jgi:hypothetical protein
MAQKLTDRTIFAGTVDKDNDLIHFVDVSDPTQDPAGSSFSVVPKRFINSYIGTGSEVEGQILYYDNTTEKFLPTSILHIDDGNNYVGIGITSALTAKLHVKSASGESLRVDGSSLTGNLIVLNTGETYIYRPAIQWQDITTTLPVFGAIPINAPQFTSIRYDTSSHLSLYSDFGAIKYFFTSDDRSKRWQNQVSKGGFMKYLDGNVIGNGNVSPFNSIYSQQMIIKFTAILVDGGTDNYVEGYIYVDSSRNVTRLTITKESNNISDLEVVLVGNAVQINSGVGAAPGILVIYQMTIPRDIGASARYKGEYYYHGTTSELLQWRGNEGISAGTSTPNASAIMQAESTTKGFLPPRMTTAQRDAIATPAEGLVIYNTNTQVLNYYNGTVWAAV